MTAPHLATIWRHLWYSTAAAPDELTDAQLLRRFVASREEAAFAALLQRHGPLVWGVCRHVLPQEQDAEDAFQTTFLVLARKADAIRKHESLASFLHGVAYRVALKVRSHLAKRQERKPPPPAAELPGPASEAALRELQAILDEEVFRLPEKLRAPFVLCCLEGRSKAEAADELGWKEGTVSGRLAQARERLRQRLLRRGVSLSAALTIATLAPEAFSAAVPASLACSAVEGAVFGKTSASVAALAEGVTQTLFTSTFRLLVVFLGSVLLAVGAGLLAYGTLMPKPQEQPPMPPPGRVQGKAETPAAPKEEKSQPQPAPAEEHRDVLGDPLPPGAVARLGTQRLHHGDIVTAVAYSPDGKVIAAGGNDPSIRLWDPTTGKEVAHLAGHTGYIYSLAFSPDGQTLASAGRDGLVCLWSMDLPRGNENGPRKLQGHQGPVLAVAFAPDGTLVSGGQDGTLRVWDPMTARELRRLGEDRGRIRCLAFAPDGKTLAAAHLQGEVSKSVGQIHLWDFATGKHVRQIGGQEKVIYRLAFSPDGLTLASGQDDGPKVWEVASGSAVMQLRTQLHYTPCVAISPDGRKLIAGGPSFLREWTLPRGRELRSFEVGQSYTYCAAFSPDGKTMATGGTRQVTLWDLAIGKPRHSFAGHQGEVNAFLFTPDGKEVLTGGYDRPIYRWEIATGREVGRLNGPSTWNSVLALSPDGKSLAGVGPNLSVVVMDAATGQQRVKFVNHLPPRTSAHAPMAVVFSPDGKRVISSTQGIDNTIRVWEADTGKELLKIDVDKRGAGALALAPDGKTLYSSSWEGSVRVWDLDTGKEVKKFPTPGRAIARLALSPDGRRLACAGGGMVFVWDTTTGKELAQLPGHTGWSSHLVFSADGRTLAVAGEENQQVRFWEVATGKVRLELGGHSGAIRGMAFSPDGRLFATGSSDTTALLWDFRNLPLAQEQLAAELSPKQLDALWADLTDYDARVAFRAVSRLARSPRQAMSLFGERLQSVRPGRIDKLIAQLDDDEFAVREQASLDLEALGRQAEKALRRAVKEGVSAEVRFRAELLLGKLDKGTADSGPQLRAQRMLEVLELIGTPESRRILEEVAKGPPEAELTREARATLARLPRKK